MKKLFISLLLAISATAFLGGCAWSVGGSGPKTQNVMPTTGQQLVDLQKARDSGAITDAEFQAQKTKLLAK